jgi:iodotyrosine deiodinase
MSSPKFIPLKEYQKYSDEEMIERSRAFYSLLKRRRTIRKFSDKKIPLKVIKNCIKTASTAPSGANMQPWQFVVVSDPKIKKEIRILAEKEENEFYKRRASNEWLNALKPLGTNENKPFLETAPYLIIVFSKSYELKDKQKVKIYYPQESTGIACGILITAIHNAGLVSLTHTPSPMRFLNKILNRPSNERPFLILVVGYPAKGVKVPNISKKKLNEIAVFI